MRIRNILVLSLVALAACVHFPSYPRLVAAPTRTADDHVVVFRDVRVFRGTGPTSEPHLDVIVADGRIVDVRPTGEAPPAGAEVVSGEDLSLLPGFVDLHAHLTYTAAPPWYLTLPDPDHNAQAHLFAGVTTVLDLGGDTGKIVDLRERIARGDAVGPRIFFAGPQITAPRGYPANMIRDVYGPLASLALEGTHVRAVTGPADVAGVVDMLHAHGATFVKLIVATDGGAPRLDEETLRAAVQRAHDHGMKVAAHVDGLDDARLAARVGVDLLAHGVQIDDVSGDDARALAASGIAVEPTLVSWERWDELADGHYVGSAIERASEPRALLAAFADEALRAEMDVWARPGFAEWGVLLRRHRAARATNLARLHAAGVPVLVGSDAEGSIATFAGAYHDELRLQVEAGLSPGEVLWAATGRAARFLTADPSFGTIEPGKVADLLLVHGDPVKDITCTSAIARVYVGGKELRRIMR
jgi:imidazolonepropionase-like amidohydrolase